MVVEIAAPLGRAAMVVQQHVVAGAQLARLAPVGFGRLAVEAHDTSDPMILGKPQPVAVARLQLHDRFRRGAEKPFVGAAPRAPIDERVERRPRSSRT